MEYQLVIQFRGDSPAVYDAMIKLEDQLIEDLADSAEVDGHDCGSGTANIFIFTGEPAMTFTMVKERLKREGLLEVARAAYREVESDDFTVIWPEGSTEKFNY